MVLTKRQLVTLLRLLFLGKSDRGYVQFVRYGFVGGVASLFDVGSLYGLVTWLHVHYLVAVAIAFIIGVTVNYLLSIQWVFTSSGKRKLEFTLFALIGVGGLVISELLVWSLVSLGAWHYLAAKLVAIVVVLVWNFGLRKVLFARLAARAQTASSELP